MAQVILNRPARPAPPPLPEGRRGTGLPEEREPGPKTRPADHGPIALDADDRHAAGGPLPDMSGGAMADSVCAVPFSASLDPIDTSAWESAWIPESRASDPTGNASLRFELQLRSWGRLEIGCAPLHPRGWHVSIASDDAAVRRRLRDASGRLGAALRQLAGHDDMTVEIGA